MTRTLVVLIVSVVGCGGKLDAPNPPEAGADVTEAAAEVIEGGTTCVPFDGASPPPYTSGVGCFSNGVMTIDNEPVCGADQFSVACIGAVPLTPIPYPPDAGDCTIVGIPTPENVLFWCCRCAF